MRLRRDVLDEDVLDEIPRYFGDRQLEVAAQLPDGTTTRARGRCALAGLSEALLQPLARPMPAQQDSATPRHLRVGSGTVSRRCMVQK